MELDNISTADSSDIHSSDIADIYQLSDYIDINDDLNKYIKKSKFGL